MTVWMQKLESSSSVVNDVSRKALFFDIDGTLLSEVNRTVPDSARQALAKARACGHLVLINTGRTCSELGTLKSLFDMDGWLCGCGTYVESGGNVLYHRSIPEEQQKKICRAVEKADVDCILEGKDFCYVPGPDSRFERGMIFRKNLPHAIHPDMDWHIACGTADKFCIVADEKSDLDGFWSSLDGAFDVIDRSGFYECVPTGHSKATAIDVILNHYGLTLQDAYVFGDSTNDLAMFEHVPNGIVMGKHAKELEPYATFVTKTVEEDGIWYAMEQLGLLEP
ncbi:MAG: HAD-IIB family hydrolase [Brotaphodocola sp.]